MQKFKICTMSGWENPKLDKHLREHYMDMSFSEVKFNSAFLNQQYKEGNIYKVPDTLLIRCKASFELDGDSATGKKKLNKIVYELKKEDFTYDYGKDAYSKPILP